MAEIFRPVETVARRGLDSAYRTVVHPYITRGEGNEDREVAHERALNLAEKLQENERLMGVAQRVFTYDDPLLYTEFAGVTIPNPLGIAAGFDKNARIHRMLGEAQGFGLVTVGSITKVPYEGNPRPRIFDLPHSDGVINRTGFPGEGADEAEKRLREDDPKLREYGLIVNLAASKPSFERGTAIEDYVEVAKQLLPYGDIHEINVSSPNTEGVRGLQDPAVFAELASELATVYRGEDGLPVKPYIFKFSPDLPRNILLKDVQTAIYSGAQGITVTNSTTNSDIRKGLDHRDKRRGETGGISGAPLREKALQVSNTVFEYTKGDVHIKRAGGIKTAQDMWDAFTYGGAHTAEVYTAFVRRASSTPNFTQQILSDLTTAMRRLGMESMSDFDILRGKNIPFPKRK